MKAIVFGLALACAPLAGIAAEDHPELTPGDEAYSAENYELAARLYRKDAELGVIVAQVSLAVMYMDGLGVAQSHQEAAKWFAKAAEQGNAEAQHNLGQLYQVGQGVAQNPIEADKWFILSGAAASSANVEKTMNPAQIAEARKLAEDWKAAFKKARER
ncbi:MAG: tetratricopeptide repeat protein [Candidatus Methylumidiphilus sp.]